MHIRATDAIWYPTGKILVEAMTDRKKTGDVRVL